MRRRLILCSSVLGAVVAVVPTAMVGAADSSPTTTTSPATTSTTTSLTAPPTSPTSTTVPAVATIPANPNGERSALSPDQTVAAQAELATLTDAQRGLLRQLQTAKDVLAIRRFALVALAREVAAARDRLEEARATERQANARVAETREQVQRVKDEVAALTATAYMNQTGSRVLGAIGTLDADNASALARAQTYARADVVVLGARVDSLTVLQRRLETQQRAAADARALAETGADDLNARLADQQQAFDDAADATARAQAAALRSLGADAALVAQMIDPRFGADDISAILAFVQADQPAPFVLDGIFVLPLPGASLSSPFGLRIDPIGGSVGFHAGLDFSAEMRAQIHASGAGTVVVAGDCGGYGTCVVIDHGASLATLYGHQSQLLVKVGDAVTAGQVLGLVGSTGISTGPHLHFEVRLRGAPIDPVPTLTG